MGSCMENVAENCLHLRGLRAVPGSRFQCPVCNVCLDLEGVEQWVRAAEKSRDGAYSIVESDEFAQIVREEWQREVYRRRKVLYELRNVPHVAIARPEMILMYGLLPIRPRSSIPFAYDSSNRTRSRHPGGCFIRTSFSHSGGPLN